MKKIIYLVPALSLAGCTSQQVEEKPNVIVILADDLGSVMSVLMVQLLFIHRILTVLPVGEFVSQTDMLPRLPLHPVVMP